MAEQKIILPGWNIGKCIGQGSFGSVYEIYREEYGIQERAALKVLHIPQDPSQVDTLRASGMDDESITNQFDKQAADIVKEYQLMMGLKNSPYIVHCEDLKVEKQGLGFTLLLRMELLVPLIQALEQGNAKTEAHILRLGSDLCAALDTCRQQNILHRDVKPQNIFLAPDGSFKLGDFGIARTAEAGGQATVGVGTHSFMAPEVLFGRKYDARADIYSLGLVLYWLLNHYRGPFLPQPPAVMTSEIQEKARALRFGGEPLPAPAWGSRELQAIVLKACAFAPEQRYAAAADMKRDLDALAEGRKEQLSIPLEQPASTGKKKKRILPLIAAGVLALAGAAWALSDSQKTQIAQPVPTVSTTAPTEAPVEVTFQEPSLEEAIRQELGKNSGPVTTADCEKVTKLVIDGETSQSGVPVTSLEDLQYLPALMDLTILNYPELEDLSGLAHCQGLRTLSLSYVPAPNLEILKALPRLYYVAITCCGTEDYSALTGIPELTNLSLSSPYLSAEDVESGTVSLDQGLLEAQFDDFLQLDDAHTEVIYISPGSISGLRTIQEDIPKLDDILRQLPQLDTLLIDGAMIQDHSVLLELPELTSLCINGISQADGTILGQLTQLTTLIIQSDPGVESTLSVSLKDLSFLAQLTGLKNVSVHNVDDPNQLAYFEQLSNLVTLRLNNCGAAEDSQAVEALREALPQCSIIING